MADFDLRRVAGSVTALLHLRDCEGALAVLDGVLKKYPNNTQLLCLRAKLLILMKDYASAVKVCNKLLIIDKKLARAYYWKGRALERLGKSGLAQKNFNKFIKLSPPNIHVGEVPAFMEKDYPFDSPSCFRTITQRKVEQYFKAPETLQDSDKALCDLFMIADPQVREKLKQAFPDMHKEFLTQNKGIYKLIKISEIQTRSDKYDRFQNNKI